jgi:hypothetical protein
MATLLRPQAPQAFDEPSVSFSFKTFMDPLWHVTFDRMQFRNERGDSTGSEAQEQEDEDKDKEM